MGLLNQPAVPELRFADVLESSARRVGVHGEARFNSLTFMHGTVLSFRFSEE